MKKLTEVAPPSKKAEEWIKANKAEFKKQYGDEWEPILYATAWKMYGKKKKVKESAVKPDYLDLDKDGDKSEPMKKAAMDKKKKINEHKDPSEYIKTWTDLGFDIDVEDISGNGKKFKIKNKAVETFITEPEEGSYKTADGKMFKSFDEAMDHLLKNTFNDVNVSESINYLKKMAGIPKTEKNNLTESFTPMADTVVFKQPNDLSIMSQKLNEIVNSDSNDHYLNKYYIETNSGKHKFSAKQYNGYYEIYYDNTGELIHKGKGKVDRFNFISIPEVVKFRREIGSYSHLTGSDAKRYDPVSLKQVREGISFVSDEDAGISEEDDMTIRELKIACYTSNKILEMVLSGKQPERWNLSKITLAADYLTTVYTFMCANDEQVFESLNESQLNEIFNRRLTDEEKKVANDIYNMAMTTARMNKDDSPVRNPDFMDYIKRLSDYPKYKEIISKSWKKGYAAGRS